MFKHVLYLWKHQMFSSSIMKLVQCIMFTVKLLNIWTSEKTAAIILKLEQYCFTTK